MGKALGAIHPLLAWLNGPHLSSWNRAGPGHYLSSPHPGNEGQRRDTSHVVYPSWGLSVIFLSLPVSLKGPALALCLCSMGNEVRCQGLCLGPHRETGVACSLELMTSLNAEGLANFTWFRSFSTLSCRVCRVGVLI